MPRPRKTIDAAGTAARLDGLRAAVRRGAAGAEADPFDEAMTAALAGAVDALKAEGGALAEVKRRMEKAGRRSAALER